jgi:hypothetical protein
MRYEFLKPSRTRPQPDVATDEPVTSPHCLRLDNMATSRYFLTATEKNQEKPPDNCASADIRNSLKASLYPH